MIYYIDLNIPVHTFLCVFSFGNLFGHTLNEVWEQT